MKTKTAKWKLTKRKKTEQSNKSAQEKTLVVVPDDVAFEILVRLPARSVGRFRCVSKSWLSVTTNWTFVQVHTQHSRATRQSLVTIEWPGDGDILYFSSSIATDSITYRWNMPIENSLRSSCDGLLCLWNSAIKKHSIFNPLTDRSINLPTNNFFHSCILAFYFHHSQYCLLATAQHETSMLFVAGGNSWKHISCQLPAFCDHSYTADLNGCLHWLAWKQKTVTSVYGSYRRQPPDIIMTFDKKAEAYGLLSLPPFEKLNVRGNLVNFNGELGLWVADNFVIDLWVMEECWVKKYSLNYGNVRGSLVMLDMRPALGWTLGDAVYVGDEVLLIGINVSETPHYLVRWNLKSGSCTMRNWKKLYPYVITTFSYMESLFDPNPSLSKRLFRPYPYNTRVETERHYLR